MGLLSFLFGGKKKDAAKAVAKPSGPAAKAAAKTAPVVAVKGAGAPRAAAGVLALKLAYAASVRAGDNAKAYEAACRLAGIYRRSGAKALEAEYRAAADARFADMLAAAGAGRRARAAAGLPAKSRAVKLLGGPQAVKLVEAHAAFRAKLDAGGRMAA